MSGRDTVERLDSLKLAQLHHDICFGASKGRIIWQPRIGCWYHDKIFAGEPLPEPYDGKSIYDIYRMLGCSARLYEFNACFVPIEDPAVKITQHQINKTDVKITVETPVGKQMEVRRASLNNPGSIHVKWPITSEEELKVAIWREERKSWRWDAELYQSLQTKIGDLGAPTIFMPRVNVQDLFINQMGVEDTIYALYDWPDTSKAYFDALDTSHDRLIDLINTSPIDIINFGDNIHASTLSPELFETWVLPAYQRRCEKLHTAKKFTHAHWDGDVKPLLKYAMQTQLDGIEAITPQPQGDVTLEEVRDALGDQMFLLDGIPAVYFDSYYSEKVLIDCVHRLIELFAPRLILGISDEMSSTGDIRRIQLVGEIVRQYHGNH